MNKITAIIQARLGSTRLKGKTLMTLRGTPLLGHLIKRLRLSRHISDIVVATTVNERDEAIVTFARENHLKVYRGSEDDVLDRFYKAAVKYQAETIVRVTPDCPMLDPRVLDRVISKHKEDRYDYVANTIKPTFPDGLDTEVFSFNTLKKAWSEATLLSEREHVTPYIYKKPHIFRLYNVENEGEDLSWMRWTVDTMQDYRFVSKIFEKMNRSDDIFFMEDVLNLLKDHPEFLKINHGISRNEGYQKSLERDWEYEPKA
jgi:spore coat polysaccharide biosynthesis protein SpsF